MAAVASMNLYATCVPLIRLDVTTSASLLCLGRIAVTPITERPACAPTAPCCGAASGVRVVPAVVELVHGHRLPRWLSAFEGMINSEPSRRPMIYLTTISSAQARNDLACPIPPAARHSRIQRLLYVDLPACMALPSTYTRSE